MKKLFYTIAKWIKSLFAKKSKPSLSISLKSFVVDENGDWHEVIKSKKQVVKEFNEERIKRNEFGQDSTSSEFITCTQPDFKFRTCTPPNVKKDTCEYSFQNSNENLAKFQSPIPEIISETIHPSANRKERFSISHEKVVQLESSDSIFCLTEKQFMFYSVIKDLTMEYGKARAKDICIRYVGELNKNIPDMEVAEWMFKLSAHNKTMKFLLKSGLVIKLNKGYKAIK